VVICAIEPHFFAELLETLGITDISPRDQYNRSAWQAQIEIFAAVFAGSTRDAWCETFSGKDACFAPVLSLSEAPSHEHNKARNTFIDVDGVVQPGPAPRFSRTPSAVRCGPDESPGACRDVLSEWGLTADEIFEIDAGRAYGSE